MRALVGLLTVLMVLVPPGVASAQRPDSDAPAGADSLWLPDEEWVMERWMPFDEERLYSAIGLRLSTLYPTLKHGDASLAQIARRRKVALTAEFLIGPELASMPSERKRTLLERTRRMLTQRHLAEHVLGHTFHHDALWADPSRIWGPRYTALRDSGLDIHEISANSGVSRERLQSRVWRALERSGRRGVHLGAIPLVQERRMRSRHREFIGHLLGPVSTPRVVQAPVVRATAVSSLCVLRGPQR